MQYQLIVFAAFLVFSTKVCTAQHENTAETPGIINSISTFGKPRAAHTATRLLNGDVLITGGMLKNGAFYDESEIFDPSKDTFTKLTNKMTRKRVSHTATLLEDGRVLIVGGWSNRTSPERSAEIYDPKTQQFSFVKDLNFKRSGHTSTLLENRKVLIAGGNDGNKSLQEVEVFDPEKNSFELIGKMQSARALHSATKLTDGRILFTGGETRDGVILSDAEIFDPKTNRFVKVSDEMKDVRYKHDAVLLRDGRVLVYGGSDERDRRGKLKMAEIFDPNTETFTQTANMNFGRFKIENTAVLLSDGRVLIAGGAEEAEVYSPKTELFTKVSGSIGKSLHYASVTLLADGRALVLGGYEFVKGGEPTSTNQAWIYRDPKLDPNTLAKLEF